MITVFVRRCWETLRDGVRLWWLAPIVPLIAAIPEFVQHIAEIQLGMFASEAAFSALAMDPTRWAFGYVKIAGLFLGMLAAARFWATGARWWDPRTIAWRPFLLGLLLNALVSGALIAVGAVVGEGATTDAINLLVSIAALPLLVLMIGGILGDREATLARVYRAGWLQAIVIGVLFAAVMLGLQPLHQLNHTLALGSAPFAVWALMVWDSLLVGTMAALAGTAFHHGYRPLRENVRSRPVSGDDLITAP